MELQKMLENLTFIGEFDSVRQFYYIYKKEGMYILLTYSKTKAHSGNINFLSIGAVEYVAELLTGKMGISVDDLFNASTHHALLRTRFDALQALYILCACGRATWDHRYKGQAMKFNGKNQ